MTKIIKNTTKAIINRLPVCALMSLLIMPINSDAHDGYSTAKLTVINQMCLFGETVDQLLNHKHKTLFTDLGWRVFALDEGGYLVERIFMVSKFTELSYRWRVTNTYQAQAVSERAQNLCAS